MSTFKKNIIFSAVIIFLLFLAFRYYGYIEDFIHSFLESIYAIVIGAVMAYILNLPMTFLEEKVFYRVKKGRRVLSIISSIVIVIFVVALVFSYIIPRFIESLTLLINSFPLFLSDLADLASDRLDPYIESLSEYLRPLENLRAFLTERRDVIVNEIFSLVGSLVGLIVSLVLALAFSIYMLGGKEKIMKGTQRLMNAYLGRKKSDRPKQRQSNFEPRQQGKKGQQKPKEEPEQKAAAPVTAPEERPAVREEERTAPAARETDQAAGPAPAESSAPVETEEIEVEVEQIEEELPDPEDDKKEGV